MSHRLLEVLFLLCVGSMSILNVANCEKTLIEPRVTSPAANLTIFKKYQDYTVIIKKESQRNTRNAVTDSESLWPEATVPYNISNMFTADEKRVILQAMRHWEDCTCIRFKERTNDDLYYVMFFTESESQCSSFIGRVNDPSLQPQGILLGQGCIVFSVVVHEIGHTLGFFHEHTRADRNDYIQVNKENILAGFESQFEMVSANQATTLGIGYDYASIQHYSPDAFAKENSDTLQALDSNIPFGNAQELSPLDAAKANLLYKCSTQPKRQPFVTVPSATTGLPTGISCGQVIQANQSGVFTSSSYPLHLLNQDCAYVFVAPIGYSFSFQFTPFLLDATSGCTQDYVQIYDESSTSFSNLYQFGGNVEGRICAREDSGVVFPTFINIITIFYHTDGQKTLNDTSGLRVEYTVLDIDECENTGCHSCNNTRGSFICSCNSGYYASFAAATCYDVNECAIGNGGCQDNCQNFGGGYRCACNGGRFLQLNGKNCSTISPSVNPTNLPPGTIIPKNIFDATTAITLPPTTTAPPPTTAAPPPTTAAPPPITTAPPLITTAPPQTTIAPPPATTTPPPITTTPPPSTTAPPPSTTAPPPSTTAPPPSTIAPPPSTTSPPPATTAPPPITTAPPPATTAPPPSTTAPPPSTTAPPPTTIAPPPATTAPPPITTALPPATTAPPPSTTAPPPTTISPPPATTAPPPITTAPPPITTAPPPSTTAPPPTTIAPPPATTTTPPIMTAPPPITTALPPATTAPPPITTAPPPTTTAPPPITTAPLPSITAPPLTTIVPPLATTAPPPITTALPPATTAPPLIMTAPPPTTTALPPATTAPPPSTTAPPPTTIAPPPTTIAPPPITTAPPPITTALPPATTAPPPITTAPPPTMTAPPPFTTAPPPSTTAPPPTTIAPPPATTAPPLIQTTTVPPTLLPITAVPMQLPECGGGLRTLTATAGSLQTLNYLKSAYPTNSNCKWDIQCPEGSTIIITFANSFRLAGRMPECPKSHLIISSCGIKYGPYCHLTSPSYFTTTCNTALVSFAAGPSVGITRTGFQLNYVCKPATTRPPPSTAVVTEGPTTPILCGGGAQFLTGDSGIIQSLNWPNQPYPINQQCSWTINCPFGMEISFDKSFRVAGRMPDCNKDQLMISGCGSDFGKYCHLTAPSRIFTLCPKIDVLFKTGEQRGITRTGFRLLYQCF